ncbi:phosphatidate cytidylyltransferase [Holophaga foetida]|uniref:phosphatidate cytidylyltransferase n=1 Tax=Holophaga foetida TaxID=35839 RepID=UPI000247466E|nr:phosphatidate cytidylyltransferase [Holophaga foetida]
MSSQPNRTLDRKNLATRVGSALVFAVLFLTLLYFGENQISKAIFLVVVGLAAWMGVREMSGMGRKMGLDPSEVAGTLGAWLIIVHFFLVGTDDPLPLWLSLAVTGILIHFGMLLFRKNPIQNALPSQALTWMSALYLGLGLGFQMKLFMFNATTRSNTGGRLILALYLITCLGDTTAYFVGSLLGRHKLAPKVSPKKSWEGALGNLAGNLIAAFIIKAFVCPDWSAIDAVALGLLMGIVGQLGDLVESAWKRSADVKDSNMDMMGIPGHGGMLDRLDSLVFAAPALYAYVHFVHGLN